MLFKTFFTDRKTEARIEEGLPKDRRRVSDRAGLCIKTQALWPAQTTTRNSDTLSASSPLHSLLSEAM